MNAAFFYIFIHILSIFFHIMLILEKEEVREIAFSIIFREK